MKLIYIYHSGFAIEADNCTIIIDFFKDTEGLTKGIVHDYLLKKSQKIYVLSTHSHADHFNKNILNWRKERSDIQYIFSKEILDSRHLKDEDITYLDILKIYSDDNIKIQAFGSTDIGGSFLIECEGKKIFHAGDLNNWHWDEESTDEEILEAEDNYLNQLTLLSEHVSHLDLVMFPVDIRLGKNYMLGAKQFIDTIKTDNFAPMHFIKDYDSANAFESYAKQKGVRFFEIKEKGDTFNF